MGRLREVCGAVSGMFFVIGRVNGYADPQDYEAKKRHYADVQRLAALFRAEYGSYLCRDIVQNASEGTTPEERTPQFYRKRPCAEYVGFAAECTEKYLNGAFPEWNGKNN